MADFYVRSARALDRVLRDECSVKAAAAQYTDSGRVLAILINALAYRAALNHAIQQSRVAQLEDRVFTLAPAASKKKAGVSKAESGERRHAIPWLSKEAFLLVLCHDLLFQSRGIQAAKTWPPKVTLERYRNSIHAALVKLQIKQGKNRVADLRVGALYQELSARIPRWIRINTLRTTPSKVFSWLDEHRWSRVKTDELHKVKDFAVSAHVPNLLAFHCKATSLLLQTELYRDNWIVMQDLASCFPAFVLDPPASATVIDATSAPGNKTCHLSAIMHEKSDAAQQSSGKVIAFERDEARFKVLTKRLAAVGATTSQDDKGHGNVEPQRRDFLTTQPEAYPQVTHMLLDPSCSGSGIVNRLDWLKEDDDVEVESESEPAAHEDDNDDAAEAEKPVLSKRQLRLRQLSEFQTLMIRHAFKFPALERLVYSTCSVNAEENEQVVMRALSSPEAQADWTLASNVIPSWPTRGLAQECGSQPALAQHMIRCIPGGVVDSNRNNAAAATVDTPLPNVEASNGFFVACFVRNRKRARSPPPDNDSDQDQQSKRAKKTLANRKKKLQKKLAAQKHKQPSNPNPLN